MTERAETERPTAGISRPLAFFRGFLRHPSLVGSLVPSSGFLARRLAAQLRDAQVVVELGPGTGAVTQALLHALPARARLLAIEVDAQFAALLDADADERLIVHRGCATQMSHALGRHGLHPVDAIVSGIPFSTMEADTARRILRQVWTTLRPGGVFIAYQIRSDVARLAEPLMGRPRTALELRNAPPMRIFSWRKA